MIRVPSHTITYVRLYGLATFRHNRGQAPGYRWIPGSLQLSLRRRRHTGAEIVNLRDTAKRLMREYRNTPPPFPSLPPPTALSRRTLGQYEKGGNCLLAARRAAVISPSSPLLIMLTPPTSRHLSPKECVADVYI